ncbi:helix-turn-helix domain-containing protein [Kordia zhangzhouensis]|uniref:helix-turn-helix domain-containing protein n=1 Tax=Kordia zhangzhouensis TaxID=1620405 RepID=UPI00069BA72E|nr:helix-turn-helix domain-containing protein [Kordia zhangzhouensis]
MDLQKEFTSLRNEISELKSLLLHQTTPEKDSEQILTIKECSKLLNLSIPTLYTYTQKNKIPFFKHGRKLMFLKSSIINWIKEGKVKTTAEIEAEADNFLANKKK